MFTSFTLPAGIAGAAIIKTGADFELSMNKVRAVANLLGREGAKDFRKLRNEAKRLGATTEFSATQAAGGMQALALAGFNAGEIMKAIRPVLDLATVAQIEMGEAADISATILRAFNKDASELGRINDILTTTFTNTITTLPELGQAFIRAAGASSAMGISIKETSAVLGAMAEAGFRGEKAGIALSRALTILARAREVPKVAKVFEKLGIPRELVITSKGNVTSIIKILSRLAKSSATVGDVFNIFGERAGKALVRFAAQGTGKMDQLLRKINSMEGPTNRIAEVFRSGAAGAIFQLRSAVEAFAISIGESGILKQFTQLALSGANFFRELSKTNPALLKTITLLIAFTALIAPLIIGFGLVAGGIANIITVLAFLKGAILLAFSSSPVGLFIVALAGLIAITFLIRKNWEKIAAFFADLWAGIVKIFNTSIAFIGSQINRLTRAIGLGNVFSQATMEAKKLNAELKKMPVKQFGMAPPIPFPRETLLREPRIAPFPPFEQRQGVAKVEITVDGQPGTRVKTSADNVDLETDVKSGPIMLGG
jgi:TP901 family phage tail tape measure protein